MRKISIIWRFLFWVILSLTPSLALAVENYKVPEPGPRSGIIPIDPTKWDFANLGALVISIILTLSGIVAVVVIIWAGVRYMSAGGDVAKTEKAKQTIIWAVVGLLAISFSWLAFKAVTEVFNGEDYSNANIIEVPY